MVVVVVSYEKENFFPINFINWGTFLKYLAFHPTSFSWHTAFL